MKTGKHNRILARSQDRGATLIAPLKTPPGKKAQRGRRHFGDAAVRLPRDSGVCFLLHRDQGRRRVKLAVRGVQFLYAVLGIVAVLAAGSVVVVAVVLMLTGLARAIGTAAWAAWSGLEI